MCSHVASAAAGLDRGADDGGVDDGAVDAAALRVGHHERCGLAEHGADGERVCRVAAPKTKKKMDGDC